MHTFFQLISSLLLVIFLASCTATDVRTSAESARQPENRPEASSYKYDAWRLTNSAEFEAINVLLGETDLLIENHAYNAAADKLERVLRIKPEYAPAWSRLSWLALQMSSPEHSVQMAKRSNSFAFSNPELQALNWSFIRAASKALNDEASYLRATQKIDSLKMF